MMRACLLWALPFAVLAHPTIETRIDDLNRAIAKAPTSAQLYLRRGYLHAQHGKTDQARQDYETAQQFSDGTNVRVALGNLYLHKGDHLKAHESFKAALAKSKDSSPAWLGQAKTAIALGAYELATLSYNRYLKFSNNPQPGYIAAAVRAIAPYDRKAAIELLNDGLEKFGPVPTLTALAEELGPLSLIK